MSLFIQNRKKLIAAGIMWLIIILFAGCKAAVTTPGTDENAPPAGRSGQKGEWVTAARVVDGDTFVTDNRVRVRLIGIDTPENTKRHEPFGQEATAFTRKSLEGQRLWLEYDVARTDRYGRTLAYIYLTDGTFFNALLLTEGFAQIMTVPPNVTFSEKFLVLQRQAREKNRGLWGR